MIVNSEQGIVNHQVSRGGAQFEEQLKEEEKLNQAILENLKKVKLG